MSRWKTHQKKYVNDKSSSKLYRSMRKYKIENFICEIIDEDLSLDELRNKERFWILFFDSVKSGLNILPGGQGWTLDELDDENKEKIIEARRQGAINANIKRWYENEDISKHKIQAAKNLNTFYENVDRSEFVKNNWNSLTEEEKYKKSDGIRKYSQNPENKNKMSENSLNANYKKHENKHYRYLAIDKDGIEYEFLLLAGFIREHNLTAYIIKKILNNRKNNKLKEHEIFYNGWTFYMIDKNTKEKING
jgi:hypothetical protein